VIFEEVPVAVRPTCYRECIRPTFPVMYGNHNVITDNSVA